MAILKKIIFTTSFFVLTEIAVVISLKKIIGKNSWGFPSHIEFLTEYKSHFDFLISF